MIRPFGSWPSPVSAASVAAQGMRLGSVSRDGGDIYWIEGRPDEGGRNVLVCRTAAGTTGDAVPSGVNVRTRVHEYGGGAYVADEGVVYFSNFEDGRVYRLARGGATPEALTPDGAFRYADMAADRSRRRLVAVHEDHTDASREPVNTIVAIGMDAPGAVRVLAQGRDFYSTPRVSTDGSRICWLSWNHPHMPWDDTELWVAGIGPDGALVDAHRAAGGGGESIYQPGWSSDGTLYFVSDASGWWRLYRTDAARDGRPVPLLARPPAGAEFGRPHWIFGTSTWAFAGRSRLVVSYTTAGTWRLATIDLDAGVLADLDIDLEPQESLAADETHALFVASSRRAADAVVKVDLADGGVDVLRAAAPEVMGAELISHPESVTFPASDGNRVHAFYYGPCSGDISAPAEDRPPLIVIGHGGPTSAARTGFDPRIQFWTTRGFAVADVNYRGSSGFGRAYRDALNGRWGIADVDDMIAAAQHFVSAGKADPRRLIIRGASAGGYTALAALAFRPGVFTAGASYFGVSDLEALVRDTHKFEARYLDTLVGPWPAMRDEYRRRSPIHALDGLSCALIFFQGLEDRVVPPDQSAMMADAVRAKGLPVAYLTFEGEQHGFRKAATIIRSLEAELYFYGAAFGFEPDDRLPAIVIDHGPRRPQAPGPRPQGSQS